jgi:hypothetical protein
MPDEIKNRDSEILDWIESKYSGRNWKLTSFITGTHSVRDAVLQIINNPELYEEQE